MSLVIKDSNIVTVHKLSNEIPEFDTPYDINEYYKRLEHVNHKILIAEENDRIVGFKVGYQIADNTFYSWMGGVIPEYRRKGIAKKLAVYQEEWAKNQGYDFIEMKTRNIHKRMLIFALSNDFVISGVEPKTDPRQHRIYLKKKL